MLCNLLQIRVDGVPNDAVQWRWGQCSIPQIIGPAVQQEFTFLLRDSAFTRDLFFFSCKNTNSVLTRFQYHPGSNLTHLKSNLPLTLRPQGFQIFPAREEAGDARFFRS